MPCGVVKFIGHLIDLDISHIVGIHLYRNTSKLFSFKEIMWKVHECTCVSGRPGNDSLHGMSNEAVPWFRFLLSALVRRLRRTFNIFMLFLSHLFSKRSVLCIHLVVVTMTLGAGASKTCRWLKTSYACAIFVWTRAVLDHLPTLSARCNRVRPHLRHPVLKPLQTLACCSDLGR